MERMWTSPMLYGEQAPLRPLGPGDAGDLWTDVQDPEGRRLTKRITLAIADPANGAYKGEIVLMDYDEPNRSASLRIGLGATARGQGLGSEALRLVLAHAFGPLELHRVSLKVFAFNERAIHVYEKVGFRHEGRLREALWWDGKPYDALLMAALAPEWDGTRDNITP